MTKNAFSWLTRIIARKVNTIALPFNNTLPLYYDFESFFNYNYTKQVLPLSFP